MVFGVIWIDKKIDDPVGALSAHGLAGIWGTIACGIFTRRGWPSTTRSVIRTAVSSTRAVHAADRQAVGVLVAFTFVFGLSYAVTFAAIKATVGLRVTDEEEEAGLDIAEHGMYGYPEQFIPQSEIGAGGPITLGRLRDGQPVTATAMTGEATA